MSHASTIWRPRWIFVRVADAMGVAAASNRRAYTSCVSVTSILKMDAYFGGFISFLCYSIFRRPSDNYLHLGVSLRETPKVVVVAAF